MPSCSDHYKEEICTCIFSTFIENGLPRIEVNNEPMSSENVCMYTGLINRSLQNIDI